MSSKAVMSNTNNNAVGKQVMVTGANGYLASHIVKDLLESGHTVHACVRDASNESSVHHLRSLPGASDRLQLHTTQDLANASPETKPFDAPMKECQVVMHAATPLNVKFGSHDGEKDIFEPAMASTQELLHCLERNANTVQCLVLTSSMSAVAPRPEPSIKDESHWSDAEKQKSNENWYGCTKTTQERMVRDWIRQAKQDGKISPTFVYAAICPTVIVGPLLKPPENPSESVGGTMASLQKWLRGGRSEAPNDSLSFIDVRDCAKMHTRILELQSSDINEHQRYMSLVESLHWNDILKLLKELLPGLPDFTPYKGDDIVSPTQFDLTNMRSLNVPYRSTRETLQDAVNYIREVGGL